MAYSIDLGYGTNSCRFLLTNFVIGEEIGTRLKTDVRCFRRGQLKRQSCQCNERTSNYQR